MRYLILLLFLACLSFSANFGSSKMEVSREWSIYGIPEDNPEINFTGMLVLNNSNQKVIEIDAEAPLSVREEDGRVFVVYNGPASDANLTFRATAVIFVDYDIDIKNDALLPEIRLPGSELVMWDDDISEISEDVSTPYSSLETIRDVVKWVYANMTYDLGYFGSSKSAKDIIKERRGVCVEYTHLTISMLNSLGFKTRYIGGYVKAEDWQPHSWAEVYVDGQWVAVDSTFNEAGILSSSHTALSYGNDSSDIYDKLFSFGSAVLDSSTEITVLEENEDAKGVSVDMLFNNQTDTLVVEVKNFRNEYIFGSYERALPSRYGGIKREIVLLEPEETYTEHVAFPQQEFEEGYRYTVPAKASFNDATSMKNIIILREGSQDGEVCSSFLIALFIPIGIFFSRMIKNK